MTSKFNLIKYHDINTIPIGKEAEFYLSRVNWVHSKIFGDSTVGFIIIIPYYFGYLSYFLFVREEYRHRNLSTFLLDSARKYCIRYNKIFSLKIIFDNTFAKSLERYAMNCGMTNCSTQKLYILNTVDVRNKRGNEWISSRMMGVVDRFLNKGYEITSFSKAPEHILLKLKQYSNEKIVLGYEMPNDMNPFAFHYDDNLSFICWRDNEPVSYICVERYGDSVVVKENFCFKRFISSGVAIVPLAYFAYALWRDTSIGRVSFMILDSNEAANRMVQREYSKFPLNETIQKIYCTSYKKSRQRSCVL